MPGAAVGYEEAMTGTRLLVIGGAERRGSAILERFVALAGGADDIRIPDAERMPIALAGARLHLLPAGYAFSLTTRLAILTGYGRHSDAK